MDRGIIERLATAEHRPGVLLLRCIEPELRRAVARFRDELPPTFAASLDCSLLVGWSGELLRIVGQALVLELNVARLEGTLEGSSPPRRYQFFVDRLRQPSYAASILARYPLLMRQVTTAIDNRIGARLELAQRLTRDWAAICSTFGFDPADALVELDAGAGDSHRGGRSVAVLTFASGKRLVYKPRPIEIQQSFRSLLAWLSERGAPDSREIRSLARDGYGWVEFVAAEACASRTELVRFYRRQGANIALLYALGATDFHYENLIAAGEHPVLVDLETLFHPRALRRGETRGDALANAALLDSVMRIGLLPLKLWIAGQDLDISGLGGASEPLSPDRLPCWTDVETDEMRLEWRRVPLKQGKHRPTHRGAPVDPTAFAAEIEDGFRKMYDLLWQEREALLADDGPLAAFAQHELRVLMRPTALYAQLLYQGLHPDVQRGDTDRDRFEEALRQHAGDHPVRVRLIPAELRELERGDIPIFTTRVGSRDLVSGAGDVIPNVFDDDTASSIERRLRGFSSEDFARQHWLVRAALAASVPRHATPSAMRRPQPTAPPPTEPKMARPRADRATRLVAIATTVAERLQALAQPTDGVPSWLGLSPAGERAWTLAPSMLDLYNGLPGIALFFGQLAAITGQQRHREQCIGAKDAISMWLHVPDLLSGVGAYAGWSGMAYALARLGALLDEPALVDDGFARASALLPRIAEDRQFDVLYGSAGCLAVLCTLHRIRPDAAIARAARACGDHLIAHAVAARGGLGWIPEGFADQPLGGFSHGAAGIAWALLQLHELTGELPYLEAAQGALTFERSLWCAETGAWLDLRKLEQDGPDARQIVAWCNGAPGIGLARVRSRRYWSDGSLDNDVERAVAATVAHGFAMNQSLCHGSLGNAELLLEAHRAAPGDRRLAQQLDDAVDQILDGIGQHGLACGAPLAVESPGLMTGLAGIGYQCLRLADPDNVPSVLLLDGGRRSLPGY